MTTLMARPAPAPQTARQTSGTTRDAVFFLTIYAVLRIVLPSQYVIGPLGGAGQPAQLFGLGIALAWLADWFGQPWSRSRVKQPLKRLAFAFLLAVLASYVMAAVRPLSSAEQLAADRSVLNVIAWTGILLVGMDAITTRARLDTLLRRVVLLGSLEGALGVVQLLARESFLQYLALPGLANTGVDPLLLTRGSFLRPVGTSISPIEYGIFLTMVLPIALHYAVADAGRRSFLARWLPVVAIAAALSLSLSRSAIVSTFVALVLLLPSWPARLRRRIYVAVAAFVAVASFGLHGFFGTIVNLFGSIGGGDTSTLSRLDSYSVAWSFVSRSPLLGRGTGTFLPEYWILDNQYLGSLIEIGVVGLVCMLLLFWAGVVTTWRIPAFATPEGGAATGFRLGPALAAGAAAGAVSFAFFDAYSFPQVPSMLFLLLGCAGALRRLKLLEAGVPAGGASGITVWTLAGTVRRLWPLAAAGLVLTLIAAYAAAAAPGVFYEETSVVFIAPNGSGLQSGAGGLVATAGVVQSQLGEQGPLPLSVTANIVGTGVRSGVWVRLPNEGGQWATDFDEEVLDVEAAGGTAAQAEAEMTTTISSIRTLLRHDQLSAGVRPDQLITIGLSPVSAPVLYASGSSSRAGATILALGLTFTLTLLVLLDGWLFRRRGRASPGRAWRG
jgi:O-antigen ligase